MVHHVRWTILVYNNMKIKKEYLEKSMMLLGKIRTLKFTEEKFYPVLYKHHPWLFECECETCIIETCDCKCHKKKVKK